MSARHGEELRHGLKVELMLLQDEGGSGIWPRCLLDASLGRRSGLVHL